MKKAVAAISLILILAGAGFPYVKGVVLERMLRQSVDRANQSFQDTGQDYAIAIERYEKGYSGSVIEWTLDLGVLKPVLGREKIILVDHVSHGYGTIVSHTSLEKNPGFKDVIDRYLDGRNPLTITTEYSLAGDMVSTITLSDFFIAGDSGVLNVQPGSLKIELNKDMNRAASVLMWQGMNMGDAAEVSGITATARLSKVTDLIWEGVSKFNIDTVFVSEKGNTLEMDSVTAGYDLTHETASSTLTMEMDLGVGRLVSDQVQIDTGAVKVRIAHLDLGGLEELIRLNTRLQADVLKAMAEAGKGSAGANQVLERQMRQMGLQMMGTYEKFLRKGLQVNISELYAKIPQGEIKAGLFLGLKKNMTMAGFLPVLMQPAMVLDLFSLRSDIKIPYELVGYHPNLLLPLYDGMKTGLFLVDDRQLVHQAEIRDNKLYLNREEVVLE